MIPHVVRKAFAKLRFRIRLRTRLRKWLGWPTPPALRELQPCTAIWGETEVLAGPPAIEIHSDAVLLPFTGVVDYGDDPTWGVYSAKGELIQAAALIRGGGGGRLGQSSTIAMDTAEHIEADGDLIYGGVIISHYGHFICTSLSRLWWLAEEPIGVRKVVFHGPRSLSEELALPYIAACFARLGLGPDTASTIRRPLRAQTLTVPRPSFQEQSFVTPQFRKLCHHIGRPWWQAAGARLPPVYLSKARLATGLSRFHDEALIEETLRAGGVEIVYPETLSFAEQVGLFSQERTILGSVGSAFHTSIFAPPSARLICLATEPTINANMHLFDAINENEARYVFPASGGEDRSHTCGFERNWVLREPAKVAEELLDLAFSR